MTDYDDDLTRLCPACDVPMLPATTVTGAVVDQCPNCKLYAL